MSAFSINRSVFPGLSQAVRASSILSPAICCHLSEPSGVRGAPRVMSTTELNPLSVPVRSIPPDAVPAVRTRCWHASLTAGGPVCGYPCALPVQLMTLVHPSASGATSDLSIYPYAGSTEHCSTLPEQTPPTLCPGGASAAQPPAGCVPPGCLRGGGGSRCGCPEPIVAASTLPRYHCGNAFTADVSEAGHK